MQVWSKMDFGTGEIIFLDITQKEDMLQVEYPNCFLLDMGWYQDRYIISIIQNFDWTHPVQQYETAERNQLPKLNTGVRFPSPAPQKKLAKALIFNTFASFLFFHFLVVISFLSIAAHFSGGGAGGANRPHSPSLTLLPP